MEYRYIQDIVNTNTTWNNIATITDINYKRMMTR